MNDQKGGAATAAHSAEPLGRGQEPLPGTGAAVGVPYPPAPQVNLLHSPVRPDLRYPILSKPI